MQDSADSDRVGDDGHYVVTTAKLFDWEVDGEPGGHVVMRRDTWTLKALFSLDGAFCHARLTGPGVSGRDLRISDVVGVLEDHGAVVPARE